MKSVTSSLMLCLGAVLGLGTPSFVLAAGGRTDQQIEIPVEAVFVPERGYDNNDNVEIVIHGRLPNTCYKIGPSKTWRSQPGVIQVVQYAYKNTTGICGQGEALPPHLNVAIPFTTVVAVGQLPIQDFVVNFHSASHRPSVRRFSVERAISPNIDSLPYAMVTGLFAPDLVRPGQPVVVKIIGMLPNTCYSLNPAHTEVKRLADSYVVLPVMSVDASHPCLEMLVPFEETVVLGPALAEQFLVHVRSMSGHSYNHVAETLFLRR